MPDRFGKTSSTSSPEGHTSLGGIFQDVAHHVAEIVRSEFQLAKMEFSETAKRAVRPAVILIAGTVVGVFAVGFVLLTIVFALHLVMPLWLAALIVGAFAATAAAVLINAGIQEFKRLHVVPERTLASVRENLRWMKQQVG
jgi:uncharacterized membrane protein YqjE